MIKCNVLGVLSLNSSQPLVANVLIVLGGRFKHSIVSHWQHQRERGAIRVLISSEEHYNT